MDPRPLTTEEFHPFVLGLDYAMFVVTTADDHERSGCLVGFATQTSIDPPRFLVCLSDKNHTYRVARGTALIAVHRLRRSDHALAELFGAETGDQTDKFAQVAWRPGPGGVPVLADCPAYFVGRVLDRRPLGDHVGFLLEPVEVGDLGDGDADEPQPLMLRDVEDLDPGHQA